MSSILLPDKLSVDESKSLGITTPRKLSGNSNLQKMLIDDKKSKSREKLEKKLNNVNNDQELIKKEDLKSM
jgi:hypothetical protein